MSKLILSEHSIGAMMLIDEGEGAQSTYGTMERKKKREGGEGGFDF